MIDKIEELKAKFRSLNQRTQYYVLIGILVGILLLDVGLIMVPQFIGISKMSSATEENLKNIEQLKNNQMRLPQYNLQVRNIQLEIDAIHKYIRSESEIPMVLESISRLATQYDIRIDQLMPLKSTMRELVRTEDGVYLAISISIKAQGGFHNLGQFLGHMENEKMFLTMQQLECTGNPENTKVHDINLILEITVLQKVQT